MQKISPDSKEKVQLQVVLEAGGASTFHFNNPGGRQAQMKDRESVKSLLQDMINKFKKNVNTELELKSQCVMMPFLLDAVTPPTLSLSTPKLCRCSNIINTSSLSPKSIIKSHRFLVEHPSMFELYKFLVVSGKLTSDEFWASRINVL